jgi:DNA-binding MltR family transcriptional regulator
LTTPSVETKQSTELTAGTDRKAALMAKINASLLKESDRGCAIFGAALLGEGLEELLKAFFRQTPEDKKFVNSLFEGYAPLATFSAKLQLAYALAILSREYRDKIELIRRLRNDFAHEAGPLSFDDPRCEGRLRPLFDDPVIKALEEHVKKSNEGGQERSNRHAEFATFACSHQASRLHQCCSKYFGIYPF